jgi:hypothetical protein
MFEDRQAEVTPMVYLYWVLARRPRRSGKAWVEIIADVGLRRILTYGKSMAELHDEHVPQSESFLRAVKISICQWTRYHSLVDVNEVCDTVHVIWLCICLRVHPSCNLYE